MPWNGSGTFNLDPSYSPEVNGTVIDALRYNGLTTDIASGITNALTKDGQNVPTANIPMGGFKLTGLAAGTAAGHSVRYEQANIIGETSVTGNATLADIFATPTARVLFDGTGLTVTAFPASSLNTWKIVRFNGTNTITHGASLICPSAANITTASGDYALMVSVGSTTVIVDYFPVAGRSGRISNLLAAAGTNTIANGNFGQTWNWAFTSNSAFGLALGESAITANTSTVLFKSTTSSGSQASPFLATVSGNVTNGKFGFDSAFSNTVYVSAASDSTLSRTGAVRLEGGTGHSSGEAGGAVLAIAGSGSGAGVGGTVFLDGGGSSSGQGGSINARPGRGDTTSSGAFLITGGPLAIADNTTAKPSVTGAGTGATVTGSDGCFTLDFGTSPSATIIFTFSRPMGASGTRPRIFVTYEHTTGNPAIKVESVSTTGFTVTLSTTPSSSGFLHCLVIPTSAAIA